MDIKVENMDLQDFQDCGDKFQSECLLGDSDDEVLGNGDLTLA